jgi:fused signal recognition particle receptor
MARSWGQLLGDSDAPAETEAQQRGFMGRLRESLGKSRRALTEQLQVAAFDPADDASWERLEEALIYADVGVRATAELIRRLEARQDLTELNSALAEEIAALFGEPPTLDVQHEPAVILVVGVNGTGKTTTIAKLARREIDEGRPALLAAADTFRAAAADQLAHWAERVGADVVRGQEGADPGSVVFDAVDAAAGRGAGVVLVDTAGRMHTKVNLMEELKKIRRIAERAPGAPQEVLLVIDATTGQNGLAQARQFAEAVGVTGVVLTKLDGTAKGGIVLAIEVDLGIPVKLVGVGEAPEDLVPFNPAEFVGALFA